MTNQDGGERIRVVLVGGGQGAALVVSSFVEMPSVQVCGITDLKAQAPGMVVARQHGIPCFKDIPGLLDQEDISLVFELTGVPAVLDQTRQALRPGQELVPASATRLMFEMLQQMLARERHVHEGIQRGLSDLTNVVQKLEEIAGEASAKTGAIAAETSSVSAAAEQMSLHMASIATSSNQARNSVGAIARSTEEMTTTVSEIARNAERARGVTRLAVESVDGASRKVAELGLSARQISKVTEVIAEIADQTKLLALNATIEAARAGEAGKGFAVVASEVKELAKQTNAATSDIRMKTDAIQEATSATINEIGTINKVIADVNDIVTIIASAVEQQSIATRDMSRGAGEVSSGIEVMSNNVGQVADAARGVARNIGSVNVNLESLKSFAAKLNDSAKLVEVTSARLAGIVG